MNIVNIDRDTILAAERAIEGLTTEEVDERLDKVVYNSFFANLGHNGCQKKIFEKYAGRVTGP